MDANTGSVRLARLALVTLAAPSLVLAAALVATLVAAPVAPLRADAHQTVGRTLVYLDGELVKNTRDDHFTFERVLSAG